MADYILGCDVSHNNNVQWDKMSPDMKFVFIKASQGAGFHDPMFQTNWKTARDKGLYHGAYHFLTAVDSAQSQADNFLNRGIDWTLPNVLPPVMDVEDQVPASLNAGIASNKGAFIQLVTDWIRIVSAATGRTPIIYSYHNFFIEYLNNASWPHNPIWLASYPKPKAPDVLVPPGLLVGYNKYDFWQFTQDGTIGGSLHGGEIDLDYFNGSIEDLAKL